MTQQYNDPRSNWELKQNTPKENHGGFERQNICQYESQCVSYFQTDKLILLNPNSGDLTHHNITKNKKVESLD